MGSSNSKPSQDPQQHKFSSDHPVRFSEGLVDSLQSSTETDSTRAKNLELIIQQRVTSELEKHLAASSEKLSAISDSISKEPFENPNEKQGSNSSAGPSWTEKPLFTRMYEKLMGSTDDSESDQKAFNPNLDRNLVSKEVQELRQKLDARKRKVDVDKEVEKAKEELVICLRTNDRRPLDCWKEVEKFRAEVGRLERSFVDRNS